MVKLLLKKQLSEIFRSYFYDAKKNKPRSKASTVSLIVLYVLLMVGVIGGMFTLFSIGLCAPLHEAGLDWLYFTLFALVGVLMGVFGSVFNTFSGLYQAKDNDLLLSLPIPVRAILASRLLGVYLMGLMFSGVILLPCVIVYWAVGVLTAATVLGGIALILAVSLLVLVLSCLLGWVVAKIHSKLKRKNLLTTLIALAFFALYYMVCFRANELIEQLMLHLNEVGAAIRGSAYPLYLMGRMGAGDYLAVVLVLRRCARSHTCCSAAHSCPLPPPTTAAPRPFIRRRPSGPPVCPPPCCVRSWAASPPVPTICSTAVWARSCCPFWACCCW